jgi:hypothetical protein
MLVPFRGSLKTIVAGTDTFRPVGVTEALVPETASAIFTAPMVLVPAGTGLLGDNAITKEGSEACAAVLAALTAALLPPWTI